MHYMINGTTPYPLTSSYYTSYATAPPKCSNLRGNAIGDIEKFFCDVNEDYIIKNLPANKQQSTRDLQNRLTLGPVDSIGTSIVGSSPELRAADKSINTLVDVGAGAGDASDFLKKYGIYIAAGGGILLVMMMFLMFKR